MHINVQLYKCARFASVANFPQVMFIAMCLCLTSNSVTEVYYLIVFHREIGLRLHLEYSYSKCHFQVCNAIPSCL